MAVGGGFMLQLDDVGFGCPRECVFFAAEFKMAVIVANDGFVT